MGSDSEQPAAVQPPGLLFSMKRWFQTVRDCVGWRLVFVLVGSLLLLLGGTGWLALHLHKQHLSALLEETAHGLGQTILSSTHSSMMENDRVHLAAIVENIGGRENVRTVRLLDDRGVVRYSNKAAEVGQVIRMEAPSCQVCHLEGRVRIPDSQREGSNLHYLPPQEKALALAVPILNSPECSQAACHVHPANQRVLGMLDLELSTVPMEEALEDATAQMTAYGLITVLLISATIGGLAWRIVHRPLHAVLDGTRQLGKGDLSYRITDIPAGEIGELAQSFNEMTSRLERAKRELEQWAHTLEAKVDDKTRELEATRDQMVFAEKMASLGKLAAIVAHEVNNPLAGVLVYTKLVRRKLGKMEEEPEDGRDGRMRELDQKLAAVETEVARCGDIVRNLLRFSRHRESIRVPADLNATVERSLKLVQHKADLNSIAIELELDDALPEVTCEIAQIQQAVLAAIMNALDAMPDGGTLNVSTWYDRRRDEAWIAIRDTGPGIPEELQAKIFEPFFSTKSEGKGTGLGLSVMYGILQRHDGRVTFETSPGAGTTFWLILPAHPKTRGETANINPSTQGELA